MRIDKWLWAARFFKTRTLATSACELGRVQVQGQNVKPARPIKPGDFLHVKTPGGDFEVEVLGLSELRGPASIAQTLYRETDASRLARQQAAEQRKLLPLLERITEGKPSKLERRKLERLRGRY